MHVFLRPRYDHMNQLYTFGCLRGIARSHHPAAVAHITAIVFVEKTHHLIYIYITE